MSVIILILFNSCNTNGCTKADEDVTALNTEFDHEYATMVTIIGGGAPTIDSIKIYNVKNELVGFGFYKGDYYVPYNGSIAITYSTETAKKTDKYQVGTAKTLKISLSWYYRYGILVLESDVRN